MAFRVVKRGEGIEDYNQAKLKHSVMSAGMSEEEADRICVEISKWIEESGKPLITTIQIRDRVIVEMQKTNHDASKNYVTYEEQRDKTEGAPYLKS